MGSVQGFERLQLKTAATLPLPNGKTPVAETTRDSGPPSATEEGDLPSGAVTPSTPTTSAAPISEEVLLISWLIVLLRTREDSQFTFEWAYKTEEGANGELPGVMRLSASEVLPDLQSSLEKVASAIASQIGATSSRPSLNHAGPISLLLSTGSLTQISKGSTKNTEVCEARPLPNVGMDVTDVDPSRLYTLRCVLMMAHWRLVPSGTARTCSRLQ